MMPNLFQDLPVVGVEDGSFQKGLTEKAILAAVLFKGTWIKDVRTAKITVDGLDATEIFIKTLKGWKFEVVMLAGISFAGFNVIGAGVKWASSIIRALSVCGRVPEPVRVARLIARGLS